MKEKTFSAIFWVTRAPNEKIIWLKPELNER